MNEEHFHSCTFCDAEGLQSTFACTDEHITPYDVCAQHEYELVK